ncbi:hypothetical protein LTR37_013204 [Vermiconidia calcicola]|uniref:Uncharacterized protein n=1 Tax=Vermiconidia calcicola TaxID=1690605 RepID=A0ACC3MY61_9PEZI|nr:hypothetical protein LTR37_013204 [Vermiconidia calcicola]
MFSLTTLVPAALLMTSTLTLAAAVKHEKAFDFINKPNINSVACPQASGTIYEGPHGGRWGILCGWDTKARKYHWGPFYDLTFQQKKGKKNSDGNGETLPKQGNGPARGQGTKRSADEDGEAIYPRGDGRKPKHGHDPVRG